MNRLDLKLQQLSEQRRSGLVCYFTAGDPDFDTSLNLLSQVGRAGADIIEIGMPCSDPIADGEIIQAAHMRALASGQNLEKTLQLAKKIREEDQHTPIILMGYFNPILQYGIQDFIQDADAYVDALLIVDLPLEHQNSLTDVLKSSGLQLINMTTPNTDPERLVAIGKNATGFIYHVAANGVTGLDLQLDSHTHPVESNELDHNIQQKIVDLKRIFNIPIGVGFGIKTEQHVENLAGKADLVIIGSILVETLNTQGVEKTLNKIRSFAKILRNNESLLYIT